MPPRLAKPPNTYWRPFYNTYCGEPKKIHTKAALMFHADVAGIQAIPPELYLMFHTNTAIPKIALCTMRERGSGWAPLRRGIRRIGELPTAPKSRRPKTIRLWKISVQIMTSHRTMIKKTTLTLPHRIASGVLQRRTASITPSGALRRERHGKAGRGEKWMN